MPTSFARLFASEALSPLAAAIYDDEFACREPIRSSDHPGDSLMV